MTREFDNVDDFVCGGLETIQTDLFHRLRQAMLFDRFDGRVMKTYDGRV